MLGLLTPPVHFCLRTAPEFRGVPSSRPIWFCAKHGRFDREPFSFQKRASQTSWINRTDQTYLRGDRHDCAKDTS